MFLKWWKRKRNSKKATRRLRQLLDSEETNTTIEFNYRLEDEKADCNLLKVKR